MPRTILVHLNIEVPDAEPRSAADIADAVVAVLRGYTDDSIRRFDIAAPLAEDV